MSKSTRTREGGRRDEIVAQAVALFNAKGYAGTSVNDIADALGLSKPALYHYIQHKEDVLYWIHEDFALLLTHRDCLRVFFEHFRELDG